MLINSFIYTPPKNKKCVQPKPHTPKNAELRFATTQNFNTHTRNAKIEVCTFTKIKMFIIENHGKTDEIREYFLNFGRNFQVFKPQWYIHKGTVTKKEGRPCGMPRLTTAKERDKILISVKNKEGIPWTRAIAETYRAEVDGAPRLRLPTDHQTECVPNQKFKDLGGNTFGRTI